MPRQATKDVLVTGAWDLLGSALADELERPGHTVRRASRRPRRRGGWTEEPAHCRARSPPYPSIVGRDRINFSYYRLKADGEQVPAAAGGIHASLDPPVPQVAPRSARANLHGMGRRAGTNDCRQRRGCLLAWWRTPTRVSGTRRGANTDASAASPKQGTWPRRAGQGLDGAAASRSGRQGRAGLPTRSSPRTRTIPGWRPRSGPSP